MPCQNIFAVQKRNLSLNPNREREGERGKEREREGERVRDVSVKEEVKRERRDQGEAFSIPAVVKRNGGWRNCEGGWGVCVCVCVCD